MGKSYDGFVDLAMPPDAAFRALHDALASMGKQGSVRVDGWTVTASVGTSWKSWGEDVAGRVLTGPGGTRVEVTSRCRLPTQLFDYGKNRKNVDRVLERVLPPAGPPPPTY